VCQTDLSVLPVEAFVNNAGRDASLFNWSKRASILRHTLPKLKSLSINTDGVDDAPIYVRMKMATRDFSLNGLHTETHQAFEFTPLCC